MPSLSSRRLTKRSVDAMAPGETLWDGDVRGFCCRARTKRKVFYLKIRARGRQRWLTIGEVGTPWTVETARREAQRLHAELRHGVDVEALRHGAKAGDPTVEDLCERFIDEYARHHKRASSVYIDELNIKNHVLPLIGWLAVKDVSRRDIEQLKQNIHDGRTAAELRPDKKRTRKSHAAKGGPGAANRVLALLSKMFNLAEVWGWREEHSNPVRLVSRYKDNPCERYLSDAEIKRLSDVLDRCDEDGSASPQVTNTIRLLLLTGARVGEILTLKWEHFDRRGAFIQLPISKTGRKIIYLNDTALEVLDGITPTNGNPYVITGTRPRQHLVNIQKPWRKIRAKARLEDVRLHDLRHSFASIAASAGASLPMIGQLLGHRSPDVTQRYAHLTASSVRAVNHQVGQRLRSVGLRVGQKPNPNQST